MFTNGLLSHERFYKRIDMAEVIPLWCLNVRRSVENNKHFKHTYVQLLVVISFL